VSARVDLGRVPALTAEESAFAEAPDGTVYRATGKLVAVVRGVSPPVVLVHGTARVLALAATSTNLYVLTATSIVDYGPATGAPRQSWKLPARRSAVTSGGLLAEAGVLWAWTDTSTDQSGFEYATLYEIGTSASTVRVVDHSTYPGDLVANSAGIYFQTEVATTGYLAYVAVGGGRVQAKPTVELDDPMVIASGSLVLLGSGGAGFPDLYRFSLISLNESGSAKVAGQVRSLASTTAGLLALESPCSGLACAKSSIVLVDPITGSESKSTTVPGAFALLSGPSPALIADTGGTEYLVRLA
jgi:hypothetical protein